MSESTRAPIGLPESVEHGTRKAYRKHGCRCDECRGYQAAAVRDYVSRREGREVLPRPPRLRVEDWRSLVEQTDAGCLVWLGHRDANGYARLGGKWAHRAVYEYEVGTIPDGHELDHLCVNPPCVNPSHLDPVTKVEHVARTMRRLGKDDLHLSAAYLRTVGLTYAEIAEALGYAARTSAAAAVSAAIRKGLVEASSIPRSETLSDQDREDIQVLRAMGVTVTDLAEWYGIHNSQVSRISRGFRSGHEAAS
jgi:hypothetical protein